VKSFRRFISEEENQATIYCDLDGVLADFLAAASKALGRKITPKTPKLNNADWRQIRATEGYWEHLKFFASGRKLWSYIRKYQQVILSALPVSNTEWSIKGKRAWVSSNLPSVSGSRLLLVQRKEKQKYAKNASGRPNILIDDHPKNIREWEAAGGTGILHKSGAVDKTLAKLKKLGF
jgi:5'(3')-deoxyribonucleotidase